MNQRQYDLAVIGCGPAGLCAATLAAEKGASVVLFDEQPSPGGQIYRGSEQQSEAHRDLLGPEYSHGSKLVRDFRKSSVDYRSETKVWLINRFGEIGVSNADETEVVKAEKVIIATGAMERPVPFPGWTLPGVMNAGAGQILFKAHQLLPSQEVILAGSGPLLLLLAYQYFRAGIKVQAILDLTPLTNHFRALKYLPKALLAHQYLKKGLKYEWRLKRAGIKILRNVSTLRAIGDDKLEGIEFFRKGRVERLQTDLLLVHFGVISNYHLSQATGCAQGWNDSQQCWQPDTDIWGHSSVSGIFIVGDGAGISGAIGAEYSGKLAALQSLYELRLIDQKVRDEQAKPLRKKQSVDNSVRPFLEAYFRLPDKLLSVIDNQTIVCRCEEITAGQIRMAVRAGHLDNNQVKFSTRCGMGPCQGRQCSPAVTHIISQTTGSKPETTEFFRIRPPVNILTLKQLSSLYPEEQE